jgi:hypothetical protein
MSALLVTGLDSTEAVNLAQTVADEPLSDSVLSYLLATDVVAILRVPLSMNQSLVDASAALQTLYGSELYLHPFGKDDEFCLVKKSEVNR